MASAGGAIGVESDKILAKSTIDGLREDSSSSRSLVNSTINVEKGRIFGHERVQDDDFLSHEDPFPEDESMEKETHQFTVRAVLVGCILGALISASK
jgi:hypothetical protein